MPPLSRGLSWVDLNFLGRKHTIATAVIQGAGTLGLVDPGPSTCLETLELELQGQGVRLGDVTHILLTHIHLDHAGATGSILRRHPHITVYVHERGARHMAEPAKLLASATRLYGAEMDRLWGAFEAVPAKNLVALTGGEQVEVGGRRFEVAYTPGHASHHVSYFDPESGVAFVGDTAGVRIDGGYLIAPTPPPDIDVELWTGSVGRIEAWSPQTLFLTHFGPAQDVRPHLQLLLENLRTAAGMVRALLERPGTDEERSARFAEQLDRELRRTMNDAQVAAYALASPTWILWLGLARYWRARGVGSGTG